MHFLFFLLSICYLCYGYPKAETRYGLGIETLSVITHSSRIPKLEGKQKLAERIVDNKKPKFSEILKPDKDEPTKNPKEIDVSKMSVKDLQEYVRNELGITDPILIDMHVKEIIAVAKMKKDLNDNIRNLKLIDDINRPIVPITSYEDDDGDYTFHIGIAIVILGFGVTTGIVTKCCLKKQTVHGRVLIK